MISLVYIMPICFWRRFGSKTLAPSSDVTPSRTTTTTVSSILLPFRRRILPSLIISIIVIQSRLQQLAAVFRTFSRLAMTSTAPHHPSPLCHCLIFIQDPSATAATAATSSTQATNVCRRRQHTVPFQHWPTSSVARRLLCDWGATGEPGRHILYLSIAGNRGRL